MELVSVYCTIAIGVHNGKLVCYEVCNDGLGGLGDAYDLAKTLHGGSDAETKHAPLHDDAFQVENLIDEIKPLLILNLAAE